MKELGETPYARITTLMDKLRKECPWDSQQTFETIAPYTIEESYEVMDAVERKNMPDLKNELGDLLFQVLFHSKMADENGAFDFEDVCDGLVQKMVSRHPHVFGDGEQPDWDAIKAAERKKSGQGNTLDGVAKSLPALMRAEKLQKRAAKRGFDWPDMNGPVGQIWKNCLWMRWKPSGRPPKKKGSNLQLSLYAWRGIYLHLTPIVELAFQPFHPPPVHPATLVHFDGAKPARRNVQASQ